MPKNNLKNKCVVLYVEGQTEVEFYNKIKDNLRKKISGAKFKVDKLEIVCTKSINKFRKKLLLKFEKEIMNKYSSGDNVIVFLCYDGDGYEYGVHPAVDMKKMEQELKKIGANNVIHLVASKTIEDWIMLDEKGVLKYLGLPEDTIIKGKNGLEKLRFLFKKKNRQYLKGLKVEGMLESLDFNLICSKLCCQLSSLCKELGILCSESEDCKKKKN